MMALDWPGNVRELGARVKKYVATGDPDTLVGDSPDVPARQPGDSPPASEVSQVNATQVNRIPREFPSLKEAAQRAVEETERAMIEEALRQTFWNRRKAAKLLKISYSSLLRRIDAYNIGKSSGD
jgi:DNA-binding NtrC family response regulator